TSKLTAKIGELPSQFDELVGADVRDACAAAARAVEKLPVPKARGDAPLETWVTGDETWGSGETDAAAALAAVDLQSTDEEEEPATGPEGKKASATKVEPKVEVEGGEDEDEEEDVDAGKGRGGGGKGQQGGRGGKAAGEEADTTVLATLEAEEGAPVIETASLPARLDASDAKEEVGKVLSIVDGLVVVQGGIDNKALDLQSVICLE
ncbi:unnamed protein product, partial [Polarella glacialis]